jgi:hypothetical protein
LAARIFSSSRAGSLSVTTWSGVPAGRSEASTNTFSVGQGQRSLLRAGSNVVRPMSAASQPSRNSRMPWLSPETKAGSAVSAGQPPGVVTKPSALMLMRVRICI